MSSLAYSCVIQILSFILWWVPWETESEMNALFIFDEGAHTIQAPAPSKVLRNIYTVWEIKVELFSPLFQTVIAEKYKRLSCLYSGALQWAITVELSYFKIFIEICINNA